MAQIKFYQVSVLPGTLQPNSFYYVLNGDFAESYLTNSTGVAKSIGNTAMINSLITQWFAENGGGSATSFTIVADIAERNTAGASMTSSALILVLDATGDSTVTTGSALYAGMPPPPNSGQQATWYKVAEYESMDVIVQWTQIQGRPNSSAAQIDTAVSQSHTHANKTTLDKLSENSGELYYNGAPIATGWTTTNW